MVGKKYKILNTSDVAMNQQKDKKMNENTVLEIDSEKITNPQHIADRLNSYFTNCVEDLLPKKLFSNSQSHNIKINNSNIMFVYPVT